MFKDGNIYSFIISRPSRSRVNLRRFSFHRNWLLLGTILVGTVFLASLYGLYGIFKISYHDYVYQQNATLRAENERQRAKIQQLDARVEALNVATQELLEMSSPANGDGQTPSTPAEQPPTAKHFQGTGGPAWAGDDINLNLIENKTGDLERRLKEAAVIVSRRALTPAIWPLADGEITEQMGFRRNPFGGGSSEFHPGMDIANAVGTLVMATANGTVIWADWRGGYGRLVQIDHGGGLTTLFGHLSAIDVKPGDKIKRGQVIGKLGSSGRSTGPHLHYEIRLNDDPIDPQSYLPGTLALPPQPQQ